MALTRARWWSWLVLAVLSLAVLVASGLQAIPISLTEAFGFVSGAACVLLVVQESVWNFPVGLANNAFFILLFWQARLYGDMGLQVVYVALCAMGWWQWLHGGTQRTALTVRQVGRIEAAVCLLVTMTLTAAMTVYFRAIDDASPFLDALTTALSLVAQWLLNGKRLANWYVWITADVLYVYLYATKGLYLTAILYAGFIGLCVAGLLAWRKTLNETLRQREVEGTAP